MFSCVSFHGHATEKPRSGMNIYHNWPCVELNRVNYDYFKQGFFLQKKSYIYIQDTFKSKGFYLLENVDLGQEVLSKDTTKSVEIPTYYIQVIASSNFKLSILNYVNIREE